MTGGAAFIGGPLVKRLDSLGAGNILVLDKLHRGYSRASLPATAEFREGDIRDRETLADALKGRDIVFHRAAQSNLMGLLQTSAIPLIPMQ